MTASDTTRTALAAAGIERLVCAVHDRSFPVHPEEDLGCGAPGSRAGGELLAFLAERGFTGVQLGPAGRIDPGNLSPYDATAFTRSELDLAVGMLVDGTHGAALLTEPQLARALESVPPEAPPDRCDHRRAFALSRRVLDRVHARWSTLSPEAPARRALEARLEAFTAASGAWVETDALHEVLSRRHGHVDAARWHLAGAEGARDAALFARATPAHLREEVLGRLRDAHAASLVQHAREQLLLAEQHAAVRARAARLGLALHGDLAIGTSFADRWARAALFLPGYALGAPPSRTNPEGQPWGYPVLDPSLHGDVGHPGPALKLVLERAAALFGAYDGLRIDHPHGLVCPWVYRTGDSDSHAAVRAGARLFSTPASPAHPELAQHAIVRAEQLASGVAPYADSWVRELEASQVERYAVVLDALVASARARGRSTGDLVCEVLSTCPLPLARVLERHGLGRFRVTQKADPEDPTDVYRPEQARPADWIMVGTHDTRPIWRLVDDWAREGRSGPRLRWLAARLAPEPARRASLLAWMAARPAAHALAELAVLFTSEARNVMVFVSDLLGEKEIFNEPGVVSERNWTLRVPVDFRALHDARAARGEALDLPAALALALASRPADRRGEPGLLASLIREARAPLPPLP